MRRNQLKKEFNLYRKRWIRETMFQSGGSENDENYLKIISLGKDVIPLILDDWKETNLHWFHALTELTGAQPIKDENRGIIFEMKRDWINYFIKENRIDKLNKILDERNFSG